MNLKTRINALENRIQQPRMTEGQKNELFERFGRRLADMPTSELLLKFPNLPPATQYAALCFASREQFDTLLDAFGDQYLSSIIEPFERRFHHQEGHL
jgi:hypothetical protein